MITARRFGQLSFGDGLIKDAVEDLWEPWMLQADRVLEDETLLEMMRQELMKRCRKSKTRGRRATPVEVILRMLLLKHLRNWSFEILSREVRANLVYREFTRIGADQVPDDKTLGNLARQLGAAGVEGGGAAVNVVVAGGTGRQREFSQLEGDAGEQMQQGVAIVSGHQQRL